MKNFKTSSKHYPNKPETSLRTPRIEKVIQPIPKTKPLTTDDLNDFGVLRIKK